jgi:Zn-dependent protease
LSLAENILISAPPLIVAVVLHEIAHGYVAKMLGDPTAKNLGRLSLNPLKHIDPVMTILLPGLLILSHSPVVFGGAKPVPVNPRYFKNPRRGMAIVAIAGPIVNFCLAGLFWLAFRGFGGLSLEASPFPQYVSMLLLAWFLQSILINLVLGTFNLIPIPPLDGGRIAVGFLPLAIAKQYAKLERFGLLLVFALLYSGAFEKILRPMVELVLTKILGASAANF